MSLRSRAAAVVLASLLPVALAAQPSSPSGITAEQRTRIDSVFAKFDGTTIPGCAVGVGQGGATLYERGYGMSDLQHGVPITPSSIFHVASVSKQFTAFAVGLLADDGKLSLDDDVRKFIPELPDYGKKITVRHLIYHTSGIRDQWELLVMAGWRYPEDLFTQNDVLDVVVRQKALNFDPGTEYSYSNAGYSLLAMIVERVSKQNLREFSDARIFKPLGMTRTHVQDDHARIVPGRTSAYEALPGGGWKISIPVFDTHGATSLFTTPGDLLKWQDNFDTKKVGSPALIKDALTSAVLANGRSAEYGFGISLDKYRGAEAYGHGGADAGYRADLVRFPAHKLNIAVACNFAAASPGEYARAVADVMLDGKLEPRATPVATAGDGGVAVPPARLTQLAGVYKSSVSDQAFILNVKDGKLVLENFGLALQPVDNSRFTIFGTPVEFVGPPDGIPVAFKVEAFRDSMARLPAYRPMPRELAQFAGVYWSDELRVSYRVAVKDSALVVHPFKHEAQPLRPSYADAFVGGRIGTVRFVRTKGAVTGFRLTSGRVRNVHFEKGKARP